MEQCNAVQHILQHEFFPICLAIFRKSFAVVMIFCIFNDRNDHSQISAKRNRVQNSQQYNNSMINSNLWINKFSGRECISNRIFHAFWNSAAVREEIAAANFCFTSVKIPFCFQFPKIDRQKWILMNQYVIFSNYSMHSIRNHFQWRQWRSSFLSRWFVCFSNLFSRFFHYRQRGGKTILVDV